MSEGPRHQLSMRAASDARPISIAWFAHSRDRRKRSFRVPRFAPLDASLPPKCGRSTKAGVMLGRLPPLGDYIIALVAGRKPALPWPPLLAGEVVQDGPARESKRPRSDISESVSRSVRGATLRARTSRSCRAMLAEGNAGCQNARKPHAKEGQSAVQSIPPAWLAHPNCRPYPDNGLLKRYGEQTGCRSPLGRRRR